MRANASSKFKAVVAILLAALFLSANKACQEDYCLGCNASGIGDPTATPTETEEGDDDDLTPAATPTAGSTRTPSVVGTATNTPSVSATATPTATPTATSTPSVGALVRNALRDLVDDEGLSATPQPEGTSGGSSIEGPGATAAKSQGNWLGQAFIEEARQGVDADGDGYLDWLEEKLGSDRLSSSSIPPTPNSRLQSRFRGVDEDMDGVSNLDEERLGLNSALSDSDNDGCPDGAELISGSDPKDGSSLPVDSDSNCLSDAYEQKTGLSPQNSDSDGDGLRDDFEIGIGSNPLDKDTDRDGVLDGQEVRLGADPTVPDYQG